MPSSINEELKMKDMKLVMEAFQKAMREDGLLTEAETDTDEAETDGEGRDQGDVDFERSTQDIKSLIASRIVAENYPVEPDEYRGDEEREITKFSLSEDENLREFLIFALKGLVKELEDNELKSFPNTY